MFIPDVRYWHWSIFDEIIIVLLRRAINHDSVEIDIFFLGRIFIVCDW